MKKLLFSTLTLLTAGALNTSQAQLADGSIAPNFTITDYSTSTTHTLYDYLDDGYTVIVDMFATWCGPCWSYHNGGVLEDVYSQHGPAGMANVSGSTTDDMMVIAMDVDGTTTDADLTGSGSNTQGNWLTGTLYPMANPAASQATTLNNDYNIAYFPTIYMICPNRTIREVGQLSSAAAHYAKAQECPAPASVANDPAILSYLGKTKACGPIDLKVRLQNNGTSALTSATITATKGASVIATYSWSGNLATYATQDVTIGTYTPTTAADDITITITSTDGNTANNVVTETLGLAGEATSNNVTVKVSLDRYGSETTWKIFKGNGTVAYSHAAYTDAGSNGTYPQSDINLNLANDCYTLEVYDSYGDGFDSGYGDGLVEIWANGVRIAGVSDFPSGSEMSDAFSIDALGIEEMLETSFNVYPNPATDVVNVAFEANNADYTISLVDFQGRLMSTQTLSSLSGAQTVEIPVSNIAKGSYIVTVTSNNVSRNQTVVIK